jgi:hypothetical protein
MKYNDVSVYYQPNPTFGFITLNIDGELYYYAANVKLNATVLIPSNSLLQNIILNTVLELDLNDPKDTLDKFFRLLVLQ